MQELSCYHQYSLFITHRSALENGFSVGEYTAIAGIGVLYNSNENSMHFSVGKERVDSISPMNIVL